MGHWKSNQLGVLHYEFCVLDWNCSFRDFDFRDIVFVQAKLAQVAEQSRRGNDNNSSDDSRDIPAYSYRQTMVFGLLAGTVSKQYGYVGQLQIAFDLGLLRNIFLFRRIPNVLVSGYDTRFSIVEE